MRKPEKAPLASICVLQEAMEALQDIVSQPIFRSQHPAASRSFAKVVVPQIEIPHVALPEDDKPFIVTTKGPSRPSLAKTSTSRPVRRKAAKSPPCSPKAPKSPASCPMPSKPPRPASDAHPQSKSSLKVRRPTKRATCYQMDASADECDVETKAGAVRDSSLTRAYDVLGVPHCSLDDDSDAEAYNMPNRISISASYEALGTRFPLHPSRPASPAGNLPPIKPPQAMDTKVRCGNSALARPHSIDTKTRHGPSAMELDLGLSSPSDCKSYDLERISTPVQQRCGPRPHSIDTKIRSGPSAMELDLGLGGASPCKSYDLERISTPVQQKRGPRSTNASPVIKSSSKQSSSLTLPALPGVTISVGSSFGTKSLTMKGCGSEGAALWGMSSARPLGQWNTPELLC